MIATTPLICETLGLRELADAFSLIEVQNERVVGIRLHPQDFRDLKKLLHFPGPDILVPSEGGEIGTLWGATVFVDPSFPQGLVRLVGDRYYTQVSTNRCLNEVLPKPVGSL